MRRVAYEGRKRLTQFTHECYIFKMACVGATENDNNTNGVFVNELQGVVGVHDKSVGGFDRDKACLHVKISERERVTSMGHLVCTLTKLTGRTSPKRPGRWNQKRC